MTVSFLLTLGISGNIVFLGDASEFLQPTPEPTILNDRVSQKDIRTSLLDEVEASLGAGTAKSRLSQNEAILRPIVAAMPKNKFGNLDHSAVRYALQRLFVLRHGWVVNALSFDGDAWNSSSPSGVLKDHVPAYIEHMFEEQLKGKGFGLHETAVLAATIEHLIHNEAVGRLGAVFKVLELPVIGSVSKDAAQEVLDTYMAVYILGEEVDASTNPTAIKRLVKEMPSMFPAWADTQNFVQRVRDNVAQGAVEFDFASLARVVESVSEQYGGFQDLECRHMKDKLIQMEYRGTGRVRLSDFYKPALDGDHPSGGFYFQESTGYLRQLGALDESEPSSVMIPNYINSKTNCLATSGFYSVCCIDECGNLLGDLEQKIGASKAKPAAIASLVSSLASSTVTAPHQIPSNLIGRLEEISAKNGGLVPLHSRLFAQWMHHIFPHECSYPHMSGTTSAATATQWIEESGADAIASKEEMLQQRKLLVSADGPNQNQEDLAVEELMPWSSEDEVFVVQHHHQEASSSTVPAKLRSLALVAAAGSLSWALIGSFKVMHPPQELYKRSSHTSDF
jgi:hypothetical protein